MPDYKCEQETGKM